MVKTIFISILLLFFSACASHSVPKNNQSFKSITELSELSGLYKNAGDPSGYLSAVIWGDSIENIKPEFQHEGIEFIEVKTIEKSIIVRAIENSCSIYEKTYVLGRDFEINAGQISILSETSILTRGLGDVLVGPSYEKITLGLDSRRDAKYRNSGYAAGLAFMIIPVAVSGTKDIRFERASDEAKEFNACNTS